MQKAAIVSQVGQISADAVGQFCTVVNSCSPDNAACEGFFGRLKTELFYSHNWLSTTIEEFVAALDTYIRWYNESRIKVSLGSRSPIEYRSHLGFAA